MIEYLLTKNHDDPAILFFVATYLHPILAAVQNVQKTEYDWGALEYIKQGDLYYRYSRTNIEKGVFALSPLIEEVIFSGGEMDIYDDNFYSLVCDPVLLFSHFLGFPAAYSQRTFSHIYPLNESESSYALMLDFFWRGEAAFYGNKALRQWVRSYKARVQSEIQSNFYDKAISLTVPKAHFDTTMPDHTTMQAVIHQEAELQVERLLAFVQALRALLETFVDKQTVLPDGYPRPKDEYFESTVADPTTQEGTEYLLTGNPFPDLTAE